jgi:predicted ATPase
VLSGPAGIGKSRLLELVRDRSRRTGIAVAAHRAVELDRDTPGRSLAAALSRRLGAAAVAGATSDPPLQRVDRLGTALESLAGSRPIAILIDDAHWIDELSALALRVLVPQLASFPVLWVLARRRVPPGPPTRPSTGSCLTTRTT